VLDEVLTDGAIDPLKLDLIGRMGAAYYCRTGEKSLFTMERPADPPRRV